MNEIDRKIAEKLGYKATIDPTRDGWIIIDPHGDYVSYACFTSEELAWEVFYRWHVWSVDIVAALDLVEELKIPIRIQFIPDAPEWDAWTTDGLYLGADKRIRKIAPSVAAAILAWLEAQEAER